MWPKYTWLDMRGAFCYRFSVVRAFAKIRKTVSISPGLPYIQWQLPFGDTVDWHLHSQACWRCSQGRSLLRRSGNCAWLLRSCCGPFLWIQMFQLKAQLHQCRAKSRTTTQWVDCLIQPIFIMLLFVRGERESCAAKEMIPYFFCLYAFQIHVRYGILYIRSTHHLHSTLLERLWQENMSLTKQMGFGTTPEVGNHQDHVVVRHKEE